MSKIVVEADSPNEYLEPKGGRIRLKGEVVHIGASGSEESFNALFSLEMFGGIFRMTPTTKRGTILPSAVIKAKGTTRENGHDLTVTWLAKERKFTVEKD